MTSAVPRLLDVAAPFLERVFGGACKAAGSRP
jgi:hypothetical protein